MGEIRDKIVLGYYKKLITETLKLLIPAYMYYWDKIYYDKPVDIENYRYLIFDESPYIVQLIEKLKDPYLLEEIANWRGRKRKDQ